MTSTEMQPTMMAFPMTTQMILRHGARLHGRAEIVSFDGSGFSRASYAAVADRAARLAAALAALGVRANDRVATYCWNHQPHFEAYLAVPAMGAVLHTLNVRLSADQIGYIARHAEDRVLIADASLIGQIAHILGSIPSLEAVILVGEMVDLPDFAGRVICYDALLGDQAPLVDWPDIQENSAAVACYTSGTTGDPKGVVYSHRSIFAHSLASMGVDTFAISQSDRILLLPPMFHANAWGLPFSGWFAGSTFILPGPHLQPGKVRRMIKAERPTFVSTVPTILNDLLREHATAPIGMECFRVIVSGGSAVSPALIERVRETWNIPVVQGWGMTETSPLCVLSHPPLGTPTEQELDWRAKSGRPVPGVEVRIVDDDGERLPEDGSAVGALELRGPWIARGYHARESADVLSPDGWLRTGDVGTIDPLGYVQITDRVKDIIKSGGEWVSSVDIENRLASLPEVAEVAVIAVPDPRWEERPLALIVATTPDSLHPAALRGRLMTTMPKFCVPEYWAEVSSLPRTSVGKIDKRALRAAVADGTIRYVREEAIL
ncbi:long-chain-fatty-acid--CoA ligase [Sphingomonas sp. SUN019]|uniref:long-chain-fatty-acid--CoA ligase n=1 Tax=Sphingomonas sp. SUN019 TaxID=2937788 RepID=UPI002164AE46|nr:long-chain-fatty-acid--CoA ligase [Sphingomonas sp. SUN019]UVO49718.1 long-chain-fatty-acid--CoA ligase [Sphingomonas sp. SUN019]